METTRHFTATVYVVHDGATALHEHRRHGIHLPPGGHVERDELPHEAGRREVREETGLDPTIHDSGPTLDADPVRTLPRPQHTLLYDINVHGGTVGHQHVDLIYYARVPHRRIDPEDGEVDPDSWGWYDPAALRTGEAPEDVVELGVDAIRTVE